MTILDFSPTPQAADTLPDDADWDAFLADLEHSTVRTSMCTSVEDSLLPTPDLLPLPTPKQNGKKSAPEEFKQPRQRAEYEFPEPQMVFKTHKSFSQRVYKWALKVGLQHLNDLHAEHENHDFRDADYMAGYLFDAICEKGGNYIVEPGEHAGRYRLSITTVERESRNAARRVVEQWNPDYISQKRAEASERGRRGGKVQKVTDAALRSVDSLTAEEAARVLGCHRTTVERRRTALAMAVQHERVTGPEQFASRADNAMWTTENVSGVPEELEVMARPCSICSNKKRALFDAVLISGVTVAAALQDPRFADCHFSESAAYRHRRSHTAATVLREARASADMGAADLLEVIVEALEDVRAVRGSALASGSTGLLLRAADQTLKTAGALADRLGLDALEVARELRDAENLAQALSLTIRDNPETGAALAAHLDDINGADGLAAEVRHTAVLAALRLERINATHD